MSTRARRRSRSSCSSTRAPRRLAGVGLVNIATDHAGTPRHAPLLIRSEDAVHPSFPLRTAIAATGADPEIEADRITIGKAVSALDFGAHLPLRFHGPRGAMRGAPGSCPGHDRVAPRRGTALEPVRLTRWLRFVGLGPSVVDMTEHNLRMNSGDEEARARARRTVPPGALDRLGVSRDTDLAIIYDGECMFCASYVHLLRLRSAVGKVEILDGREDNRPKLVAEIFGVDLNDGMLALYAGQLYYGADAVHFLSTLTSHSGLLNSLMARVFRHPAIARALYPALRFGRNATLSIRGREQMVVR